MSPDRTNLRWPLVTVSYLMITVPSYPHRTYRCGTGSGKTLFIFTIEEQHLFRLE